MTPAPQKLAVEFKDVDIIFGSRAPEAVVMLDAGKTRAEILAATGSVLFAAEAVQVRGQDSIQPLGVLSFANEGLKLEAQRTDPALVITHFPYLGDAIVEKGNFRRVPEVEVSIDHGFRKLSVEVMGTAM